MKRLGLQLLVAVVLCTVCVHHFASAIPDDFECAWRRAAFKYVRLKRRRIVFVSVILSCFVSTACRVLRTASNACHIGNHSSTGTRQRAKKPVSGLVANKRVHHTKRIQSHQAHHDEVARYFARTTDASFCIGLFLCSIGPFRSSDVQTHIPMLFSNCGFVPLAGFSKNKFVAKTFIIDPDNKHCSDAAAGTAAAPRCIPVYYISCVA